MFSWLFFPPRRYTLHTTNYNTYVLHKKTSSKAMELEFLNWDNLEFEQRKEVSGRSSCMVMYSVRILLRSKFKGTLFDKITGKEQNQIWMLSPNWQRTCSLCLAERRRCVSGCEKSNKSVPKQGAYRGTMQLEENWVSLLAPWQPVDSTGCQGASE